MIIIDENYAIDTDSMGNYSLFRRKKSRKGKKAGEEIRDYVGHFNSLRGAVKSYIRDRFNSETQLMDAVKRLEAIEKDAISKFGL